MLTLVVPGLIWPRQALADLTCDLPLPAFSLLLGRGRLGSAAAADAEGLMAAELGAGTSVAAAALRRLAFGRSRDDAEWLCLDPVRLRFEERSMVLDDPTQLDLDASEAEALAVSLAPTFAPLGEFERLAPPCWNLHLQRPAPAFAALQPGIGRAVAPLPTHADYRPWRQALNEAQMVLHAHPVNLAREAAGRPTVNSLWPWGGGRPLPASPGRHDLLWAADPVLLGLAVWQGVAHRPLPARLDAERGHSTLALFDALAAPARLGDALAWRDALARLEADWLAPALAALRAGRLDRLRLLAPGEHGGVELHVARSDLWKFWRKPRPLAEAFTLTPMAPRATL
ncbi:MAG: hypothetical protein HZB40_02515 [Rhodocyclales bacterium]|nr:hypothetical protein [Rhodocyclales bacterium]